jgi:hypothetical protein
MSELAVLAEGSLSRLSHVVARLEERHWVRRTPTPPTAATPSPSSPTTAGTRTSQPPRPRQRGPPTRLRPAHQDANQPADDNRAADHARHRPRRPLPRRPHRLRLVSPADHALGVHALPGVRSDLLSALLSDWGAPGPYAAFPAASIVISREWGVTGGRPTDHRCTAAHPLPGVLQKAAPVIGPRVAMLGGNSVRELPMLAI